MLTKYYGHIYFSKLTISINKTIIYQINNFDCPILSKLNSFVLNRSKNNSRTFLCIE